MKLKRIQDRRKCFFDFFSIFFEGGAAQGTSAEKGKFEDTGGGEEFGEDSWIVTSVRRRMSRVECAGQQDTNSLDCSSLQGAQGEDGVVDCAEAVGGDEDGLDTGYWILDP